MAAYGAVISLTQIMEKIQLYHADHHIFHDKQQRQLQSLHQKVGFFQHFLENSSRRMLDEAEGLEGRIANVAYGAEDIIESYIVDHIHWRLSNKRSVMRNKHIYLAQSTNKGHIRKDIDSIRRIVMDIKETSGVPKDPRPQEQEHAAGLVPPVTTGKDTVVGFDDISTQIMDKLTGEQPNLQITAITGMGGIGKSTLAKNVYHDTLIVEQFDIRRWLTVSQEFDIREILLRMLVELKVLTGKENFEYHQLGEKLYRYLLVRRYLITIDDIWSLEAWDKLRLFLPDNNNCSRVVITTRLSNLANNVGSFHNVYKMNLLDEDQSWSLLQKTVFSSKCCPLELVEIGKRIALNSKGLPLSIVVIGRLLAKCVEQKYWNYIAQDTSASVNLDQSQRCLEILYTSYNHLPIHLKPCFLYFGVFPEDHEIRVSELIKLWVAEGFLKPNRGKSLEEVARGYLNDLIDRNLTSVSKFGSTGNVKSCKIHDLLRDLCLRESKKQGFLHNAKMHEKNVSFEGLGTLRRIAINSMYHKEFTHELRLQSPLNLRSLIYNYYPDSIPSPDDVKLLRILVAKLSHSLKECFELLNSRYLDIYCINSVYNLPSSMHLLWNLHSITIVTNRSGTAPSAIWSMRQLRHVIMKNGVHLPDPPCDNIVLDNLHTLSVVCNFKCTEEVLRKIPNVKTLEVSYLDPTMSSLYCPENVGRLQKLESLCCNLPIKHSDEIHCKLFPKLGFSSSLKKLTLRFFLFNSEDTIMKKVGSLPHLESLKLSLFNIGEEWNSVEGHFLRLKFMQIKNCDLVWWTTESSSHFPCLEHLVLSGMRELEEIPSEIGYIPTLRSIQVDYFSKSATASAKRILEEQRSLGNEDLHLIFI